MAQQGSGGAVTSSSYINGKRVYDQVMTGAAKPTVTPNKPTTSGLNPAFVADRNAGQRYFGSATPAISTAPQVTPGTTSGGRAGGGGGGGGGSAGAAGPIANPQSMQDFIRGNHLYGMQEQENNRRMQEFDAESGRGRGEVEADQKVRRFDLAESLGDQSQTNAEDMAGRGMLRSGGTFVNQDKINAFGVKQEAGIADLLSTYQAQRGNGRVQQDAANRQALNERIQALAAQYSPTI